MATTTSIRNKQGMLDLYKGRQWKSYIFKVTGSTYFHYFSEKKLTDPKDQILMGSIKSVDVPSKPPKSGGNFLFEVKHTGKSSPWVLSAKTEEERLLWMEAILPNSSRALASTSKGRGGGQVNVKAHTNGGVTHLTPHHQAPYPTESSFTSSLRMPQPHLPSQRESNLTSSFNMPYSPNQAMLQPHPPNTGQTMPRPHSPNIGQTMPNPSNTEQPMPHPPNTGQLMPHPPNTGQPMPHPPNTGQAMPYPSNAGQGMPQPYPSNTGQPPMSHPPNNTQSVPQPSNHAVLQELLTDPSRPQPLVTASLGALHSSTNNEPKGGLQRSATHRVIVSNNESSAGLQRSSTQRGSVSDRPPMPQPRQLITSPAAEYLDPLQLNMPPSSSSSSSSVTTSTETSTTHNGGEPHVPQDYLIVSNSPQKLRRGDDKEVCLIRDRYLRIGDVCIERNTPPTSPTTPPPVIPPRANSHNSQDDTLALLQKQFTATQINELMEMFLRMQHHNQESGSSAKSFNYLLTKAARTLNDSILVTEEDDPNYYDKRPSWAKAIENEEDEDSFASLSCLLPEENEATKISKNSLLNMNKIGAGQFGEVYSADYSADGSHHYTIQVAVKTAKKDCTEQQRRDILREISVMANMVHPNIVRLYGIVQEEQASLPWLVLEYLTHGDLKHYLTNSPKKSMDTLVKYMVDVAMGMHYIAERGLIHRDLAARNVLVGEGELCKVADFGLLRELPQDDSIYVSSSNVPCPIRWMPPEAVTRRSFSVASDVWSFGVLQWEMLNPGKLPYPGIGNYELLSKINDGYRMPVPRGCPPIVSRIMKACWHVDPKKRPSFLVITSLLTTKVSQPLAPPTQPPTPPTQPQTPPTTSSVSTEEYL